jgi:hypothetical protein
MEISGSGAPAGGYEKAEQCIRAGHEATCEECHPLRVQLSRHVVAAGCSLLLPPGLAPDAACVEQAFEQIRDHLCRAGNEANHIDLACITKAANAAVSAQFVAALRAGRDDAWLACDLRLLQLARAQFDHREEELALKVKDKVLVSLLRFIRAGNEVSNIGGLMSKAIKNAANSEKRRLMLMDSVAGIHNPERALPFSALGGQPGQDDENGPEFDIGARDDALEQINDGSEEEARLRLVEALTIFFEEVDRQKKSKRKQQVTQQQRAEMILDALTNCDLRHAEIAKRYDVNGHYVDVQVNRFRTLRQEHHGHELLLRLLGIDRGARPLATETSAQAPMVDGAAPATPLPPDAIEAQPGSDTTDVATHSTNGQISQRPPADAKEVTEDGHPLSGAGSFSSGVLPLHVHDTEVADG